jgi:hypothetical protein
MSGERQPYRDEEGLRAAWRAREAGPGPIGGCPAASDLWSAVRGELPPEARRAVVDHTSSCAACAEAWRLAVALNPDPIPLATPRPRSVVAFLPRSRALAPLAAAAVLAVALAGGYWLLHGPRPGPAPEFRGAEVPAIRSLLDDGETLPRGSFRLRWSSGPDGSRYDVHVTTESLQVVASFRQLVEPAVVVPESALVSLPAGTRVLWRVQAVLPDGERVASPTYVARLK